MDPKLRPSFADIVRHLEEILEREIEHERDSLTGDNDKKTVNKGTAVMKSNLFIYHFIYETLNGVKSAQSAYSVLCTATWGQPGFGRG